MHANMLQMQAGEVFLVVEKSLAWVVLLWGTAYGHTFCSSDDHSLCFANSKNLKWTRCS